MCVDAASWGRNEGDKVGLKKKENAKEIEDDARKKKRERSDDLCDAKKTKKQKQKKSQNL